MTDADATTPDGLETATLGGGCFWCLEAVFQELEGVHSVKSGYSGGHVENPTYRQVCGKGTGHAEVVHVTFDPAVTSFRQLLRVFFTIHDPTTKDRQGADVGPQYRSIVLYRSPEQERATRDVIAEVEEAELWPGSVVTEVVPFERFWPAEAEHDQYYARNRNQPYCRVVIDPKVQKFRESFPEKRRAAQAVGAGGRPVEPPVLFVGLVVLEVALSVAAPRPRMVEGVWAVLGVVPAGAGLWLHLAADRAFARAGTTRATRGLPRLLVTGGVYGRSRNPMYLGGALFLVGLAIALGPAATLAVPALYVALVGRLYIGPEEEVLERRFGLEWRAYRARVRRWL